MRRNKVSARDIATVVLPNANPLLITDVLLQIGFDIDQIYIENVGQYGHLDGIDFIVNLKHLSCQRFTKEELLLTVDLGWAGLTPQVCLRFNNVKIS
jgi:3-oxoacyl-[acyl-carrier-protein] synthase III